MTFMIRDLNLERSKNYYNKYWWRIGDAPKKTVLTDGVFKVGILVRYAVSSLSSTKHIRMDLTTNHSKTRP